MRGATCEEVSSALAFILSLALTGQDQAASSATPPPDLTPPHRDEPAALPPPELGPTAPAWTWAVGATLGIRYGIAPTWANVEKVDVEVSSVKNAPFFPSLRIGVVRAEPVTRIDRFGTTNFAWTAGRAAGCPLHIHPFASLEIEPCIGLELGAIGAAGAPSSAPGTGRDSTSTWADVFGGVRVQFHLVGPLFAIAEGEMAAPLIEYQFAFDPSTPVYEVPAVAAAGFAGLLAQFP